eukprot:scaffold53893_cov60-Phaeocystis_antarctica.AAC.1
MASGGDSGGGGLAIDHGGLDQGLVKRDNKRRGPAVGHRESRRCPPRDIRRRAMRRRTLPAMRRPRAPRGHRRRRPLRVGRLGAGVDVDHDDSGGHVLRGLAHRGEARLAHAPPQEEAAPVVGGVEAREERTPPQHDVHSLGVLLLGLLALLGGCEPRLQAHARLDGLFAPLSRRRHGELRLLRPERCLAHLLALRVRHLARLGAPAAGLPTLAPRRRLLGAHLLAYLLAPHLGRAEPREHPLLLVLEALLAPLLDGGRLGQCLLEVRGG